MKFIGKVLLVFSFVVTYLVLLILITAKYQFLNNDFWIQSFRQGEVYSKLENPLQKSIREVFIKEGAGTSEAKEISSILEKETLQVLVERNLINTLAFVNGKVSEITIFFPLEKLPKSIRQDLEINSDEFSLNYLLSTFGSSSSPVGSEIFVQIRSLGNYIIISLIVTIIWPLFINLKKPARGLLSQVYLLFFPGYLELSFL